MPLFRLDGDDRFVPFQQTPFEDLEARLEHWVEQNPRVIFEDEMIAFMGRQPRTADGKYLDLLGIDRTGATVIVELKRGQTPRDVVAQALEYAAWVDGQTLEELDEIARSYTRTKALPAENLQQLYRQVFGHEGRDAEGPEGEEAAVVTFNHAQRIVIMAQDFTPEVERTLRYLRTSFNADVYGVKFTIHKAGDDTILNTETIVGREAAAPKTTARHQQERWSNDAILAYVTTDFMKKLVHGVESWISDAAVEGLRVEHAPGTANYINYQEKHLLYYYYAKNWLYCWLYDASLEELDLLRSQLQKPLSLSTRDTWGGAWRFHLVADSDFELLKSLLLKRFQHGPTE